MTAREILVDVIRIPAKGPGDVTALNSVADEQNLRSSGLRRISAISILPATRDPDTCGTGELSVGIAARSFGMQIALKRSGYLSSS